MRPALLALGAAALAPILITVAGCGGSSTAPLSPAQSAGGSASPAVNIKNFMFGPGKLTVKAGTRVTWTNQDPTPTNHTATANDASFDTGHIAPGGSASHTFDKPGTYAYHCDVHEYMTAVVQVTS